MSKFSLQRGRFSIQDLPDDPGVLLNDFNRHNKVIFPAISPAARLVKEQLITDKRRHIQKNMDHTRNQNASTVSLKHVPSKLSVSPPVLERQLRNSGFKRQNSNESLIKIKVGSPLRVQHRYFSIMQEDVSFTVAHSPRDGSPRDTRMKTKSAFESQIKAMRRQFDQVDKEAKQTMNFRLAHAGKQIINPLQSRAIRKYESYMAYKQGVLAQKEMKVFQGIDLSNKKKVRTEPLVPNMSLIDGSKYKSVYKHEEKPRTLLRTDVVREDSSEELDLRQTGVNFGKMVDETTNSVLASIGNTPPKMKEAQMSNSNRQLM